MHSTGSPEPIRGPQGLKELVTTLRTAFPDLRLTVDDMVAEGDKVVDRFMARGTHQGELFGIAATGKQVAWLGIAIHRIVGGQLVETWASPDTLGLMRQLGAVPTPK
jgi:predicted ester cyclase